MSKSFCFFFQKEDLSFFLALGPPDVKFAIVLLFCFAGAAQAASTVDSIRGAGHLTCGVVMESADWNKDDLHGSLDKLDRAMCGAAAIAVLGAHAPIVFREFAVELDAEAALAHGQVDMIAGVTPTATATTLHHIWFSPVFFYDDVSVLARKSSHIANLKALGGKKLCYEQDTDLDRLVQARLIDRGIKVLPFPFQEEGEMNDALIGGHCDAMIGDRSKLAQIRAVYPSFARFLDLLPQSVSLDPVAAATRQDDPAWTTIVAWTITALMQAEAVGVTQDNAASFKPGDDVLGDRLLGVDWATGQALGLPKTWTVPVLSALGNYGEIYERTVGAASPYKLPRGFNALWRDGGLLAPLPMR
jgi:general L-amino acid transport system substrate-binding protein